MARFGRSFPIKAQVTRFNLFIQPASVIVLPSIVSAVFSIPTYSAFSSITVLASVLSATFSTPTFTVVFGWQDKYPAITNAWSDKFGALSTTWNNKY